MMTGRDWALKLAARHPNRDWMAELSQRSGEPRDKVEWHLQEAMEPPAAIAEAARAMLAERDQGSALPDGELNADDLPFAGVPQILGKLHKD